MSDSRFTILSTASLPFERINHIPDSVEVRIIPFTEITARSGEELKRNIEELSRKKINVVFTSAHAVRIVAGFLSNSPAWKIYCIRNETRNEVIKYFGSDSVANFAANALLLSEEMLNDEITEAFFFCGDQRLHVLPDNLRKKAVRLHELIVYDTQLTPREIDLKPDAVLFFSPSAVRSFFSTNKLPMETIVFAMGSSTASAIKHICNPVVISPNADKAYVFNMVLEYAGSHPTK